MKRIAIGQAGGPTAVLNTTLVGLVDNLKQDYELLFIKDGYEGLVHEKYTVGSDKILTWLKQQKDVAGAALGSGRYQMSAKDVETIILFFKKQKIDTLIFIGGNGTMEALSKIQCEAKRQKYALQVIGLPKTVDNDIYYTDHAPGFGSAAKYVAYSTRDLSNDLKAMKNFEQVRIIETMGRNAGWLAAASGYLKELDYEGPHYIALPERKLDVKHLEGVVLETIDRHGYAIIVVSEGVQWENGAQIEQGIIDGRKVLGGISQRLADYLRGKLNLMVRAEKLGMNQRCSTELVSLIDKDEAYAVGKTGAEWVQKDYSGVMVTLQRKEDKKYEVEMKPISLQDVANKGERLMPDEFIDKPEKYYAWLAPLID